MSPEYPTFPTLKKRSLRRGNLQYNLTASHEEFIRDCKKDGFFGFHGNVNIIQPLLYYFLYFCKYLI